MTSLLVSVGMLACEKAGSTGGENAKLLALYHAGMLCQEGSASMLACERAERLGGQNAGRRECETAGTLSCWHALSEDLMLACAHARGPKGGAARMREGETASSPSCWHALSGGMREWRVPFQLLGAGSNLVWKAIADLEEY
jgi:hypothetical protein